eukprot:m.24503 g.24503  ORF g.24503 m.24503 type:complete len:58 (+) comp5660_c0_seq1:2177-2350(+)
MMQKAEAKLITNLRTLFKYMGSLNKFSSTDKYFTQIKETLQAYKTLIMIVLVGERDS